MQRLTRNRTRHPECLMVQLDHSQPLPFPADYFEVIAAGLCLHYFSWDVSFGIAKELRRVLQPGGRLVGRLNSTGDFQHGAGLGEEIEDGLFLVAQGDRLQQKRFFSEQDVVRLFSDWTLDYLNETRFEYYGNEKVAWEFALS